MSRHVLIVSVCLVLAGCGDDAGGGPGSPVTSCDDGCRLEGECVPDGFANPSNPCQACNRGLSASTWSDRDGSLCDDGAYCTVGDVCHAGTCSGSARSCSDGIECTGTESCDEETDACLAGTPTCQGDTICNAVSDRCEVGCTGCVISDVCYGDGQLNPLGPCERCDGVVSTDAWSPVEDGARCDDGIFCNGVDSCVSGACVGHEEAACPDDGLYCTGVESCVEVTGSCTHSGNPCSGADLCIEAQDQCCVPNVRVTEPECSAAGDVIAYDSCGTELILDDCLDAHGICSAAQCGCAPGWGGEACSCVRFVDGEVAESGDGSSWAEAFKTVQEAIVSAAIPGGCAVWVKGKAGAGQTYAERITLEDGVALYGGFQGGEQTFEERDVARYVTILDGSEQGAVVTYVGEPYRDNTAILDGFTVTRGSHSGMRIEDAEPTVSNCVFTDNSASDGAANVNGESGGGIYIASGSPTFTRCRVSDNRAGRGGDGVGLDGAHGGAGGGVYIESGTPTFVDCAFVDNQTGAGGDGGRAQAALANGGAAGDGGGIYVASGAPILKDCRVSGNRTGSGGAGDSGMGAAMGGPGGSGGGIRVASGTPTLTGCTISGNRTGDGGAGDGPSIGGGGGSGGGAGGGGGLSISGESAVIVGCIISANQTGNGGRGGAGGASGFHGDPPAPSGEGGAGGSGGGLTLASDLATITSCTLSDNQTGVGGPRGSIPAGGVPGNDGADGQGGAIFVTSPAAALSNSIIWNNTAGGASEQIATGPRSSVEISYCDLEAGCSAVVGSALCEMTDAGGSTIDQNPAFATNGVGGFHLTAGSPCIDAGSSAALPADTLDLDGDGDTDESLPFDVDGDLRVLNAEVDMGADEFWAGCGNHVVDTGEECDDGNVEDRDGCSAVCSCEPGLSPDCPVTSCRELLAIDPHAEDGIYWLAAQDTAETFEVACDMSTDGGGWTLALRLNTNDETTRQWNASFWDSSAEIGDLAGHDDYLSPAYYTLGGFTELLVDYRYSSNQAKRMAAVFAGASDETLKANTTGPLSNDNPAWTRQSTFESGTDADASSWYGDELRFQTTGNGDDGNGNDAFRIWYNQVAVDACNQAGGIGGQGDGGAWYHEVSFPSATAGCQENSIRGRVGTNGGGTLMGETLLPPEDAYDDGIMTVLVR